MRSLEMAGLTFGRLTALERVKNRGGKVRWKCSCTCGRTVDVDGTALRSGNTASCGCVGREKTIQRNTKHGLSRHPEYLSWLAMKSRCDSPTNSKYADYGGRGIGYCKTWSDFNVFLADMGRKPEGYTLERLDNDADYGPQNCQWVSRKVQTRNRRCTLKLTHNGVTLSLAEWSEKSGIPYHTLKARKQALGWPDAKALATPVRRVKC